MLHELNISAMIGISKTVSTTAVLTKCTEDSKKNEFVCMVLRLQFRPAKLWWWWRERKSIGIHPQRTDHIPRCTPFTRYAMALTSCRNSAVCLATGKEASFKLRFISFHFAVSRGFVIALWGPEP